MEEYNNKFDQKVRTKLGEENPEVPAELEQLVKDRLKGSGLLRDMGPNWIFIMSSALIFFGVGIIIYMSQNSDAKIEIKQTSAQETSAHTFFNTGNRDSLVYHSDPLAMNSTKVAPVQIHSTSSSSSHHQNKTEEIVPNNRQEQFNPLPVEKYSYEVVSQKREPAKHEQEQSEESSVATENASLRSDNLVQPVSVVPVSASGNGSQYSSTELNSENKGTTNAASSNAEPDNFWKTNTDNTSTGASILYSLNSEKIIVDQNPSALASTSGAILATGSETISAQAMGVDPIDVSFPPLESADVNSETGIGLPGEFKQSLEAFGGIQWTAMQENSGAGGWNSDDNSQKSKFNGGVKWNLYRGKFSLGAGLNYSEHNNQISTVYDTIIMGQWFSFPAHISTEYNLIDVPILVGYLTNINRIMVHIETGMSISLIEGGESNLTIDSTGAEVKKLDQFSTANTFNSFILQVSVLYPVSDKFSIFIQPTLNYGRTTIYRDLDQMINLYSIRTGVRWTFQQ